ncbi:MAG: hypothetical protein K2Y32_18560 [Candidatus Obscuribacterales bacterium]|nr:hypothetical protein [Candidatus Obscuribacterales bacterium]
MMSCLAKLRGLAACFAALVSMAAVSAADLERKLESRTFGRINPADLSQGMQNAGFSDWLKLEKTARDKLSAGQFADAEQGFKEAISKAETLNMVSPGVINSLMGLSFALDRQGNQSESERIYELAMRNAESVFGPSATRFGYYMPDLAWLYHWHGKDSQAETLFLRAISLEEASSRIETANLVELLKEYQQFLKECGRTSESEKIGHRIEHIKAKLAEH